MATAVKVRLDKIREMEGLSLAAQQQESPGDGLDYPECVVEMQREEVTKRTWYNKST